MIKFKFYFETRSGGSGTMSGSYDDVEAVRSIVIDFCKDFNIMDGYCKMDKDGEFFDEFWVNVHECLS